MCAIKIKQLKFEFNIRLTNEIAENFLKHIILKSYLYHSGLFFYYRS